MSTPVKTLANAIRFLSAEAVQKANSGHPGMPMGMADVATVLFTRFLKFDAAHPEWPDRDRFVLSAGHGSMLLYSLLYLTGCPRMTMEQIRNFRQFGSLTPGHPEYGHTPGVETTTGPLGQGITTAVGMALAERMMNARFGSDLVDHHTYVIAGDGCLMEGISQEAISLAGHLKLGRLIVLWDDNKITIDGATSKATSEDQLARFAASGWDVQAVDAYDAEAVAAAIAKAKGSATPSLIACRSVIAYGAPTKAGTHGAHGSPLGDEEIAGARKALGWTSAPFEVPADILAEWRLAGSRGRGDREAWQARLAMSENKSEFERLAARRLPDGWKEKMTAYRRKLVEDKPKWATRKSSGEALEVLTAAVPELVGGSADLTGSVNTYVKAVARAVTPEDFGGRYIHYGVREHAMGAVMNGLALHGGIIPYSGTFLVFADYMRGAMRLSSLMGAKVVYVLTHDSIGVGEDGPTHQPVETLATLRCLPGFKLFRPADAVEAAECWEVAIECAGPVGIVCSRQAVPALRKTHIQDNQCARGGYVLAEAEGGSRKVTLLSTGTELYLAVAARDALQAEGIPAAVVSMPCWALFDAQDAAYKAAVLGKGTARVAVEAALEFGWSKYLGERSAFVGMTGFGASAPAETLYEHFGITAAKVVAAAKALV